MRRREFIALLPGAVTAWSFAAQAQQTMPVVGFLNSASPVRYAPMQAAFLQGLGQAGYVEGRNVTIEYRWADDQYDRLPALAADLVRRRVSVISANYPAVAAAKAATKTIPIVFTTGGDPVRLGFVASLSRPGGNLTGVTTLSEELGPKRLQVLHELVPAARTIGVLVNPGNRNAERTVRFSKVAATRIGLQLHIFRASTDKEMESVFSGLAPLGVGALMIGSGPFFTSRAPLLAALAMRHKIAVVDGSPAFARNGGLASYGGHLEDSYREAGRLAGRILNGEKAADLPVQQRTWIRLVVNRGTAKRLGLIIPPTLLARADEVIE